MYDRKEMPAALLVPRGNRTEVLQSIDAAFDKIALLIGLWIMAGWTSALLSSLQTSLPSVFAFGTDAADSAGPKGPSVHASPIRPVHSQAGWSLPGTALHHSRHPHRVQERHQKSWIRGLPGRHQDGQGPSTTLTQDMDFTGASTTADPEPFVSAAPLFSPVGMVFLAPLALRCARMWVLSTAALSQSISPC